MAYFTPYIDATGMHIPTYIDIRDELISQMKQIFGSDIYIEEDSQDYQQISILAKKIHDTNSLALLAYNNRTPNTSIGIGLDNLCSLVGITRKEARKSKVQLTITGIPSTTINNGQASDGVYIWDLPSEVIIPANGEITVLATCESYGSITAAAGTITQIETPIYGWYSVTNNYPVSISNVGSDAESDASLRGRYANATLLPSVTVFEGMIASVQDVENVLRVKAYENDTGTTSDEGFPPHSVAFVVEGGDDEDIATAIYFKKTPGCYTDGTTEVELSSLGGNVTTIRFYRPEYKNIYVKVYITPLAGYSTEYSTRIKEAIEEYINSLQISDSVYTSMLLSIAISQMGAITNPAYTVTSVTTSTNGSTYASSDITMLFNQVASTDLSKITVVINDA